MNLKLIKYRTKDNLQNKTNRTVTADRWTTDCIGGSKSHIEKKIVHRYSTTTAVQILCAVYLIMKNKICSVRDYCGNFFFHNKKKPEQRTIYRGWVINVFRYRFYCTYMGNGVNDFVLHTLIHLFHQEGTEWFETG